MANRRKSSSNLSHLRQVPGVGSESPERLQRRSRSLQATNYLKVTSNGVAKFFLCGDDDKSRDEAIRLANDEASSLGWGARVSSYRYIEGVALVGCRSAGDILRDIAETGDTLQKDLLRDELAMATGRQCC